MTLHGEWNTTWWELGAFPFPKRVANMEQLYKKLPCVVTQHPQVRLIACPGETCHPIPAMPELFIDHFISDCALISSSWVVWSKILLNDFYNGWIIWTIDQIYIQPGWPGFCPTINQSQPYWNDQGKTKAHFLVTYGGWVEASARKKYFPPPKHKFSHDKGWLNYWSSIPPIILFYKLLQITNARQILRPQFIKSCKTNWAKTSPFIRNAVV